MAMCFLRQLAAEMTIIVAVLLAEAKKQKQSRGKKPKRFADFSWLAVCPHNRPRFQRPSNELQTHLGCACRERESGRAVCWVCPDSCNGSARIALFSIASARLSPLPEKCACTALPTQMRQKGQALPLGDMQYCSFGLTCFSKLA